MAMIPIWLWLNYEILSKNSIEMFAVLYVQNFHDMELVYVCVFRFVRMHRMFLEICHVEIRQTIHSFQVVVWIGIAYYG